MSRWDSPSSRRAPQRRSRRKTSRMVPAQECEPLERIVMPESTLATDAIERIRGRSARACSTIPGVRDTIAPSVKNHPTESLAPTPTRNACSPISSCVAPIEIDTLDLLAGLGTSADADKQPIGCSTEQPDASSCSLPSSSSLHAPEPTVLATSEGPVEPEPQAAIAEDTESAIPSTSDTQLVKPEPLSLGSHPVLAFHCQTGPSLPRGVTQYSLDELCDEMQAFPAIAQLPIADLYRREIPTGVQHEFIMIRSAPCDAHPAAWIRIDRMAERSRRSAMLISRYPAADTVCRVQSGLKVTACSTRCITR